MYRGQMFLGSNVSSWNGIRPLKRDGASLGSESNPAVSGVQLMTAGMPSGNYYIKPSNYSGAAKLLYVNNDNLGGGWVLVGKGRQSNDYNSGWFGTNNDVGDQSGLILANYLSAGISKVNSTFVNYLMNGTENGWQNNNANNYLVVNRPSGVTDGYGNNNHSAYIKVTNQSAFSWVNQFGAAPTDNSGIIGGSGTFTLYNSNWLTGGSYLNASSFADVGSNDCSRWFQWHWSGHGDYHGWSSGSGCTNGFQNGSETHAIQFVHVWAR